MCPLCAYNVAEGSRHAAEVRQRHTDQARPDPRGAFSLRNYRTKAGNIPLGTEGYVITTRDSNPREYLVKLDGHRNPRHVEEGWIEQA